MNTKILIVEDDDVNIVIVEYLLQKEGFEVETASNGEEAVDMVRDTDYSLILMDIEMPIMNGLEATRAIRRLPRGRKVPIIALTAHSVEEKLKEIQLAGMNDFLLKPLDQAKTSTLVKKYL
jgi:CheY-like chemotaxis protein